MLLCCVFSRKTRASRRSRSWRLNRACKKRRNASKKTLLTRHSSHSTRTTSACRNNRRYSYAAIAILSPNLSSSSRLQTSSVLFVIIYCLFLCLAVGRVIRCWQWQTVWRCRASRRRITASILIGSCIGCEVYSKRLDWYLLPLCCLMRSSVTCDKHM